MHFFKDGRSLRRCRPKSLRGATGKQPFRKITRTYVCYQGIYYPAGDETVYPRIYFFSTLELRLATWTLRPIPTYAVLFFFDSMGFSANRGRFTLAKPRSRPCASRNEFICSLERYPAQESECPPAQFELLPNSQDLTQEIWSSSKSRSRPILYFANEGQLQIFRGTMHRRQKLELCLWRSGCLSWIHLGETADSFREVCCWFPRFSGPNEHERKRRKEKKKRIRSDPHRNRPKTVYILTLLLLVSYIIAFAIWQMCRTIFNVDHS